MKSETTTPTVMLVDDTPANLRLLQEILRKKGYRVVAFPQGETALRAAAKNPPDIILLDIMMPDLDGFEVCARLKADRNLRRIPILFISSLSSQGDKARAFAAGGVDYVTKPFEEQEVLARVGTHLKLYRLNRELEKIVEERTAELVQSNETLKQEINIRKKAEEQLRSYQAMLRSVFEGIAEPLILVDQDLRVKLCNKSASAYYQAAGIEFAPGKRLCDDNTYTDSGRCDIRSLREAVAKGVKVTLEKKGDADPDRIEQVVVYPVEDKGGNSGGAIIRIADITEERRLSQEMAQADKLIALGTMVAGVAHEINNPNHVILLNTPVLLDVWQSIQSILDEHLESNGDFPIGKLLYSQLKQEIPDIISDIESSANRIKRIVAVLKNYSAKNQSFVLAPVDINEVVEDVVLLMSHKIKKSTSRFHVAYGKEIPSLTADQQKLEQVVANLIANALEALPDTNRAVFVATSYDKKKHKVVVEIRDEGVGIPPTIIPRIMDPFFTTKRATGGTGLGMDIVQRIIKLHQGSIEVKSEEGAGSAFKIMLPGSRLTGNKKSAPADDDANRGAL